MKAPCCILGASALPRPPEKDLLTKHEVSNGKSENSTKMISRKQKLNKSGGVMFGGVTCLILVLILGIFPPSSHAAPTGRCSLMTGDAARRAAASAQVLEAEVATSPAGRNVYTAALTVRRVLRRYRGPGRLKKQDTITLTLQREPIEPCIAVASLEVGRKYFVFMDAPMSRGVAPKAVAAPLLYSKRARRLIRQQTCSKCARRIKPPRAISRLAATDSAVRGHSVNFTCVFEGFPPPTIQWFKDGVPIDLGRGAILSNDVSAPTLNTNTLTIKTRRLRSRRIVRRRRRRRRRRSHHFEDPTSTISSTTENLEDSTIPNYDDSLERNRIRHKRHRNSRLRQNSTVLTKPDSTLTQEVEMEEGTLQNVIREPRSKRRYRKRLNIARHRQRHYQNRRNENINRGNEGRVSTTTMRSTTSSTTSSTTRITRKPRKRKNRNRSNTRIPNVSTRTASSSNSPLLSNGKLLKSLIPSVHSNADLLNSTHRNEPKNTLSNRVHSSTKNTNTFSIENQINRPPRGFQVARSKPVHRGRPLLNHNRNSTNRLVQSSQHKNRTHIHKTQTRTPLLNNRQRAPTSNISTHATRLGPLSRSSRVGRRGTRRILSSLSIEAVEDSHSGEYTCRASSRGQKVEQKIKLTVIPPLDPGIIYPCPYDSFCLNGGTCMFFKFVGELVCQCVEGFKGQRCQEKEVYTTVDNNCRGLSYVRRNQGLRCPRNQPVALWQLLQLSIARRQFIPKIYPWTQNHIIDWTHGAQDPNQIENEYAQRQHSEQIQRNRQLLRTILSLDIDEAQSNSLQSNSGMLLTGGDNLPTLNRRNGQLESYSNELEENYSDSIYDTFEDYSSLYPSTSEDQNDLINSHHLNDFANHNANNNRRRPSLQYTENLTNQNLNSTDDNFHSAAPSRSSQHSTDRRNHPMTWSAHFVHTTQIPKRGTLNHRERSNVN